MKNFVDLSVPDVEITLAPHEKWLILLIRSMPAFGKIVVEKDKEGKNGFLVQPSEKIMASDFGIARVKCW